MRKFIVRAPPPPFIKDGGRGAGRGGLDFFKIDRNEGGGLKIFARKGGLDKMGGIV